MTKLAPLAALLAALLLPSAAVAAEPTPMPVTAPKSFFAKAAPSNLFEIQSSELALKHSKTPVILMFARRMIVDHGKAAKAMTSAAGAEHVAVPGALEPLQVKEMAELQQLDGPAFDDAYVMMQVAAHDQAVKLFKAYPGAGAPGPLKRFAAETLPTLQMHQQMIHSIAGR